jgi:hypothetical protein
MSREVLYHGTRYPQSVLSMGCFILSGGGEKVCFTRSADEAAYWALLPRIDDEGCGAILIFNRQLLQCQYKIGPYHDPFWDTDASRRDEAEEGIWADVTNVGKYLVGFVSDPKTELSKRHKMLNHQHRLNMEDRLNGLLYSVPEWRHRPEELIKSKLASMRRPTASPGSSA